jgi:hypothetical protein
MVKSKGGTGKVEAVRKAYKTLAILLATSYEHCNMFAICAQSSFKYVTIAQFCLAARNVGGII